MGKVKYEELNGNVNNTKIQKGLQKHQEYQDEKINILTIKLVMCDFNWMSNTENLQMQQKRQDSSPNRCY